MLKLLIITTWLILHTLQVELSLQCQTADISQCASGYKFNITGDGLQTKFCIPQGRKCNITSTAAIINVNRCQTDYRNSLCSSRACFTPVEGQICMTGLTSCSSNTSDIDTYDYLFGNCSGVIRGCRSCLLTYKNQALASTYKCLGSLWQQRNATNYKLKGIRLDTNITNNVSKCTQQFDAYGLGCSCCTTKCQNTSYCTNNYEVLAIQDISNWMNFGRISTIVSTLLIIIGMIIVF